MFTGFGDHENLNMGISCWGLKPALACKGGHKNWISSSRNLKRRRLFSYCASKQLSPGIPLSPLWKLTKTMGPGWFLYFFLEFRHPTSQNDFGLVQLKLGSLIWGCFHFGVISRGGGLICLASWHAVSPYIWNLGNWGWANQALQKWIQKWSFPPTRNFYMITSPIQRSASHCLNPPGKCWKYFRVWRQTDSKVKLPSNSKFI